VLATSPFGASSNIALWRAKIKPPVELVVGDLGKTFMFNVYKIKKEEGRQRQQ